MPPKIIHLCWFSKDPYPLEIKICLASWKRVLPDYKVRVWTYEDAKAIGCKYIDQALSVRKWAFAADVVRFYAVYKEGGVYMDSDIYLRKRFDRFIPETGCATFNERWEEGETDYGIQAAFFIGSKGNDFCKEVFEYYQERDFIRPDGSLDQTISPYIMRSVAERRGYVCKEEEHIWMVYIYILLIGCRQEAASSIVRMLLGNIGCTEAGVTISLAGNWNVRSSISVMR